MLSERNGLQLFPYKGSHKGLFFFGGEIAQDFVALAGDVDGNLIGHGRCRRTGAGGEGEDVQISEGQVFDEAAGGFEFGVGLTGESGHDVGADGGDGHGGVNFFDLLAIVPGTIFAVHAAKHGVTAGLQRDVRVLGDARRGGDEGDEIVGQSIGSTEEMRSFSRRVSARMVRMRDSSRWSLVAGRWPSMARLLRMGESVWLRAKSRPQRPRVIPLMTTSR